MSEKKYKIVGWDHDGPSLDNNFVPSIVIQKTGQDTLCIGFSYDGGSSLETQSYGFDHANRHRGNRSWGMSQKRIEKELEGSNMSLDKLKTELIKKFKKA